MSSPSQVAVFGADGRSALGLSTSQVLVSGVKGNGRSGRLDQARMGNFSKGRIMVLSPSILAQIKASPTMIWGWFDLDEMKAWQHIFPLMPESKKMGWHPLSDPAWMEWAHPWWIFPSDIPTKEEAQVFG